ncbi:glucose dehydrogenase [FAD, quinone] [Diaphorina citri]|uniref:Glucose dehydrogenase [FAD, quinone] n=1 Tax=Diaphorina citri TaxID=121845 RepID=A0A3Q0JFF1_DIACI|nr:glucose dehydrogenase [FAD, quinone] [Diaphorina citri]
MRHCRAVGNTTGNHYVSLDTIEEVLPYFKKSMDQRNPYLAKIDRYHATGGYLTVQDSPWNTPLGLGFLQAGEEMGYNIVDYNGAQQTGFSLYQFTMRRGNRCSTAKAFLSPVKHRKNLHVALWSHVTRVMIDPNSRRAYGVEYLRDGRLHKVFARKEVILSAGALNSPQLLMLSGIGPREHLAEIGVPLIHDSPGVGQNLQDHIAVGGIVFKIDYPVSLVMNRMVTVSAAVKYATQGKGPLTSSVGLETVAFITTKYGNITDDWPDIEFMLTSTSTPSDGGTACKHAHGLTDKFYDDYLSELNNKDLFGVFPMILRPKSRGHMKLRSNNPLAHPLFYHNYLTHPDDVRVLREGVKAGLAIGETDAMKRFGAKFHAKPVPGCRHLELYTDDYWDCYIRQYTMTIYHMSGTTKMGPDSDPYAVVDPTLRVYGVQGLRVIDASIMPRITSGNINAPVIMIGEKGSDMIKDYWFGTEALKKKRKRTPPRGPNQYREATEQSGYKDHVLKQYADYVNNPFNQTFYPFAGQPNPGYTGQTVKENYERVLYDPVQDNAPENSWLQERVAGPEQTYESSRIYYNEDNDEVTVEDVDEYATPDSGQFGVKERTHHQQQQQPSESRSHQYEQYVRYNTSDSSADVTNPAPNQEQYQFVPSNDEDVTKSNTQPRHRDSQKMRYSDIVGTSYQGTMMDMMKKQQQGVS